MSFRRAIILAAGCGRRLSEVYPGPKCLVPIGGEPLLAYQMRAVQEIGVTEVVLVVGYQAESVAATAQRLGHALNMGTRFVHNRDYATSNTLVSLAQARAWLDGIVYCLNGDVLFAASLLRRLERAELPAAIAADRRPVGAEEVKLRCQEDGRIRAISKAIDPALSLGEAVGIARYTAQPARAFAKALEQRMNLPEHRHSYYEAAMDAILSEVSMHAVDVSGEPVIEIDFPDDLFIARERILPRLSGRT